MQTIQVGEKFKIQFIKHEQDHLKYEEALRQFGFEPYVAEVDENNFPSQYRGGTTIEDGESYVLFEVEVANFDEANFVSNILGYIV